MIGILFGPAMDYQVFLVSRMHEADAHGPSALDAIRTGFRQAAPVVVAAAAIMFFVFAGFVPSGDGPIKAIAFARAVGIAVDAFVVRNDPGARGPGPARRAPGGCPAGCRGCTRWTSNG